MAANPEAIAWYVNRSERLLGEVSERVRVLRSRGGQLAGFSGAILALVGSNAASTIVALHGVARGCAGSCFFLGGVLLIAAFATALVGAVLRRPPAEADLSVGEVANYASKRFVEEPDLWRVQLRTIRALMVSIESTTRMGDGAARAGGRAQSLFLAGLSLIGIALGILLLVVTF